MDTQARRAAFADKRAPGARPFIIGIGGGSASGKTTVVERIMERMGSGGRVVSISQDCFYRGLTQEQIANVGDYNFDHPDAMDFDEQVALLRALQQGADHVHIPTYDFCTHSRLPPDHDETVHHPDVVIFEGILALHDSRLRDMFDMSIYVDTDSDLRLLRRIRRDTVSRGRTMEQVLVQYERFVKPSHDQFIEPCRQYADLLIPFNRQNNVAVELIVDHIDLLRARCQRLTADFNDHAATRSRVQHTAPAHLHTPLSVHGRVLPTTPASGKQTFA